jgi:hypothetical protein
MNINLYCNCHKNKINKRTEYQQKNLMLGSKNYDISLKEKLPYLGFLFDDTGDNISHLNQYFGQLTGLYWVWKNTEEEIIGTNTYRLFWGDYFLYNKFKKNTLYIPSPINVNNAFSGIDLITSNIYDHYSYCHGDLGWDCLKELSNQNKIPISIKMIEKLNTQHFLYPFNMFLSERNTFNKLCDILFDILFQIYDNYNHKFEEYVSYSGQTRILDFLSERILHIIYTNKDHFFSNIDIETISLIEFNHDE